LKNEIAMVKQLIKTILYKIYKIGQIEASDRDYKSRLKELEGKLSVGEGSDLKLANILYFQKQPGKITIGKHSIIKGELITFKHGGEIRIGDYCHVGPDSHIWSAKLISIGNRVLIAHNVNIHDNISHPLDSKSRHEEFAKSLVDGVQETDLLRESEIIIEDDAWIGFNATILKGVRIGKGAIIGANTVITEDVPPYAVVVGNPAKIIKQTT